MAFQIPTLPELATRAAAAFRLNLKGSDAALWPNNVAVSAKVMAGAVWESFSFLDYIKRQAWVHSADSTHLDRHGRDFGMPRLPATFAEGSVTFTGTASVVVPSGITVQRADGVRFTTTTGGTVSGLGTVTVAVRCDTVGATGNTAAAAGVNLIAPIAGIETAAVVASGGIGGGSDVEGDESYRSRLLFRKRNPPHGGAAHDYIAWAREINGVTRVFVDPVSSTNGRTSVGIWFLMDDLYTNGIPQSADVSRVAAYIDTVRPAGAIVQVAAPAPITVPITIDNLNPDTVAIRDAIAAELADLFRREALVSTRSAPFTLYRSQIIEAIARATGERSHDLTAPATNVTYTEGQIPVLGAVTFL